MCVCLSACLVYPSFCRVTADVAILQVLRSEGERGRRRLTAVCKKTAARRGVALLLLAPGTSCCPGLVAHNRRTEGANVSCLACGRRARGCSCSF